MCYCTCCLYRYICHISSTRGACHSSKTQHLFLAAVGTYDVQVNTSLKVPGWLLLTISVVLCFLEVNSLEVQRIYHAEVHITMPFLMDCSMQRADSAPFFNRVHWCSCSVIVLVNRIFYLYKKKMCGVARACPFVWQVGIFCCTN